MRGGGGQGGCRFRIRCCCCCFRDGGGGGRSDSGSGCQCTWMAQNCMMAAERSSRGTPEESVRNTSTEWESTSARSGSSGKRPVMA